MFTNEKDLQLAKLVHTEVTDDSLPSTSKKKQPANEFVMSRLLIQSHAYFDPVKKAKVKAVHKVRNKDLVLPLVFRWHLWNSSGV